jgi:hypothetical protein
MKYFAYLEPNTFADLNEKNIAKLLVDKNLFEERVREKATVKNGTIDSATIETYIAITPTQDLKNEFYNYILAIHNTTINEIKNKFYDDFNEEIYGLELNNQRTIALKHFKEIYKDISLKNINLSHHITSDNGIEQTYNFEKIKMLYGQQRAHKNSLALTDTLEHYLTGNKVFFEDTNLVEQYQIIKDLLLFEIWKQVLIELNDRFGFEEDYYFTNKFQDDINYKKYSKIFKSLESYQFTNTKIKSFKVDEKAKSVSLYQALIDKNLIKENKEEFKRFMLAEYGFSPSEIVTYEKNINRTHDERVIKFVDDWEKFDVTK